MRILSVLLEITPNLATKAKGIPLSSLREQREDLALYDNESWNDPRDFAKLVKAITLPQDVSSTSNRRLIELENQVQRLMEAHLALTQPTQAVFEKLNDAPLCDTARGPTTQMNFTSTDYHTKEEIRSKGIKSLSKLLSSKYLSQASVTEQNKNPSSPKRVHFVNSIVILNKENKANEEGSVEPSKTKYTNRENANETDKEVESGNEVEEETEGETKEEEKDNPENIHVNSSMPPDPSVLLITEKVLKLNSFFESLRLVPQSSNTKLVCTKGDEGDVMFIEIVQKNDYSRKEEPEIMRRKLDHRENLDRGVSNFTRRIKGMHVFVGNFTFVTDFMIAEDIRSIIDPRLSQVVLGKPFVDISNMTHDLLEGVVRFTNRTNEIAYKIPHKIEQYNSLSNLEKKHMKLVYLRKEEDKRRGVEYVMSKILGFYKECLELGPEYATGMDDEAEVT
nr:retrotransposon Orf1 [Tanacetum cinerariifolium]